MFDWLFEGRPFVFILLLVARLLLLVLWWQRRDRRLLVAVAAVAGAALVYFLLSFLRETDRKQIERKVDEMAAAINANNVDQLFTHVSDNFQAMSMDKKGLREQTVSAIGRFSVRNAKVTDFEVLELDREKRKAKVTFRGSADNSGTGMRLPVRCEAEFVLEKDGQWRMKEIVFFRPVPFDSTERWNPFTER